MRPAGLVALLAAIPMIAAAQPPGAPAPVRISIGDAMRVVDRTSHPLGAARATSERAAADVVAARSGFFPQIRLTGSYLRTFRSEFSGLFDDPQVPDDSPGSMFDLFTDLPFGRTHTWRAGITASESIWDGGRTANTVALARGVEHSAQLDVRSRRAQAVLDVTDAYFAAVLAARVVSIGEASLDLAERTLEYTRAGYAHGTIAEFDVVRAEVTRDGQRTTLIRSRADRDNAFLRLRQLLGLPVDRPVELLTVSSDASEIARLARAAAGVLGTERVAVAQARASVEMRRAEVGIARSGRWPTLSIVGDYNRVNYPADFPPDGEWRTNWTVGVNVAFPLFTGFFVSADIRGARADQRAAEALLREATELAALDEARAYSDAEVADATYAASHRSTELARRAYEIAEVRYRQGIATYLELIDARIAYDRAQIDQANAARDVAVTSVRLALLPALPVGTAVGQRALAPSAVEPLLVTPPAALTPLVTGPQMPGQQGVR